MKAVGVKCEEVNKISEGESNIIDRLANGDISLVINTPFGEKARGDGYAIRSACVRYGVPAVTTLEGTQAITAAMETLRDEELGVIALQDL